MNSALSKRNPLMRSVRKYWTAEQVANTFASHQEVFETTLEWLHDLGIDSERIKHSADCAELNWLEFSATVAQLEKLIETRYFNYQHKKSGDFRVACDG
ncbi:hypothetical protein GGP41_009636 [Bipolaris sorokiniana]|uniref:Peptidase S53 activation domain-containing protein n=1 Tax=Cochliobolus sativus TaxID=45130 RepID=A0A8H5ZAM1_COCSA|nr:hypothetical protein GGP41_009636 [Bipolaris sorokiniana]